MKTTVNNHNPRQGERFGLPSMPSTDVQLQLTATLMEAFKARLTLFFVTLVKVPTDLYDARPANDAFQLLVTAVTTNGHAGEKLHVKGIYHPTDSLSDQFTSLRDRELAAWLGIEGRKVRNKVIGELREALEARLLPVYQDAEREALLV